MSFGAAACAGPARVIIPERPEGGAFGGGRERLGEPGLLNLEAGEGPNR
jgi:hypothetical protein